MPNTERILVIEDNRDAQAGLYSLLFREGYCVLAADLMPPSARAKARR